MEFDVGNVVVISEHTTTQCGVGANSLAELRDRIINDDFKVREYTWDSKAFAWRADSATYTFLYIMEQPQQETEDEDAAEALKALLDKAIAEAEDEDSTLYDTLGDWLCDLSSQQLVNLVDIKEAAALQYSLREIAASCGDRETKNFIIEYLEDTL